IGVEELRIERPELSVTAQVDLVGTECQERRSALSDAGHDNAEGATVPPEHPGDLVGGFGLAAEGVDHESDPGGGSPQPPPLGEERVPNVYVQMSVGSGAEMRLKEQPKRSVKLILELCQGVGEGCRKHLVWSRMDARDIARSRRRGLRIGRVRSRALIDVNLDVVGLAQFDTRLAQQRASSTRSDPAG